MKTITEFPGTLLRQAIVLRKQRRAAGSPAAPPPAPAEGEAPEDATPPSAPAANAEAAALGAALGVEGQRLARLMEALAVVGNRIDAVSRVRVFGGEEQPQGGRKQGDFYYVVDLIPRPQDGGQRKRDRPGSRDRGERSRPGRGPGGREREPPRSEVPAGGVGWTLARAPGDPRDERGGGRGDRRGRPGPGGERRGPGSRGPGRGGSGGGRGPGSGRDPGR